MTIILIGDFSLSELSLIEAYSKFLPERVKPYSFVKLYGEVMIRKD